MVSFELGKEIKEDVFFRSLNEELNLRPSEYGI